MQKLIEFEFFPCIKLTQSLKLYNFNKCVIVMSSNFLKNDMSPCLSYQSMSRICMHASLLRTSHLHQTGG